MSIVKTLEVLLYFEKCLILKLQNLADSGGQVRHIFQIPAYITKTTTAWPVYTSPCSCALSLRISDLIQSSGVSPYTTLHCLQLLPASLSTALFVLRVVGHVFVHFVDEIRFKRTTNADIESLVSVAAKMLKLRYHYLDSSLYCLFWTVAPMTIY